MLGLKSLLVFFGLIHIEPKFKLRDGRHVEISQLSMDQLKEARALMELPSVKAKTIDEATRLTEKLLKNETYNAILLEIEYREIIFMDRGYYAKDA